MKLKNYEEAKEYIKFVLEYGNTSVAKEKAISMTEEIINGK